MSVVTWRSSLPLAYRLYLPEVWASDRKRRKAAGIPGDVALQTKPQIALDQIRNAVQQEVTRGVVVADAGYGVDGQFRSGVTKLGLEYIGGAVFGHGLGTRQRTTSTDASQKDGPSTATAATRSGSSAGYGKTTRPVTSATVVEDRHLVVKFGNTVTYYVVESMT